MSCCQVALEKVLLLGSETTTIIGRPIVPGAHVTALLEEHVSIPSAIEIQSIDCNVYIPTVVAISLPVKVLMTMIRTDMFLCVGWGSSWVQALDAKVIIFKKKRRKNYRRTNGHRQVRTLSGISYHLPHIVLCELCTSRTTFASTIVVQWTVIYEPELMYGCLPVYVVVCRSWHAYAFCKSMGCLTQLQSTLKMA